MSSKILNFGLVALLYFSCVGTGNPSESVIKRLKQFEQYRTRANDLGLVSADINGNGSIDTVIQRYAMGSDKANILEFYEAHNKGLQVFYNRDKIYAVALDLNNDYVPDKLFFGGKYTDFSMDLLKKHVNKYDRIEIYDQTPVKEDKKKYPKI